MSTINDRDYKCSKLDKPCIARAYGQCMAQDKSTILNQCKKDGKMKFEEIFENDDSKYYNVLVCLTLMV